MEDMPNALLAEAPAEAPAETPPTSAPRRGPGRPIKWIIPTDGTPLTKEQKEAAYNKERNRRRYASDAPAVLERQRQLYRARVERQKEVARQLAELKKAYVGVMLPGLPAAQASVARV